MSKSSGSTEKAPERSGTEGAKPGGMWSCLGCSNEDKKKVNLPCPQHRGGRRWALPQGTGGMQSIHHEVNSRGDFVYMGKESLVQERVGREGSVQGCV